MEPHPDRLLRPADKHHVEQLKLAMKVNPSTDAAPIVGLVVLKEGKILYLGILMIQSYYNTYNVMHSCRRSF